MEPVKEPDSQESQHPAVPEVAPTATSTSPLPLTETVTAEGLEVLRQFRASSTRSASQPKKAKTEQGWSEFLQASSAKNIELSDLDYSLQQELQSSELQFNQYFSGLAAGWLLFFKFILDFSVSLSLDHRVMLDNLSKLLKSSLLKRLSLPIIRHEQKKMSIGTFKIAQDHNQINTMYINAPFFS